MACRPSSAQKPNIHHDDNEDEDAPTVVDGLDDDVGELQHDSLRAAFPIAFGKPLCTTVAQ